jgi:hypothetical protein
MHLALIAALLFLGEAAWAQTPPDNKSSSEHSTGRTESPEEKGVKQPQGWTGPIETKIGGAPAESPQGQSPPGMQPAPEGSDKTMVEPKKPGAAKEMGKN